MGETRRKFDRDFKEGAVRLVRETGKPIAQVARELGVNEGTLANWVMLDRRRRDTANAALGEDERAELAGSARRCGCGPRWRPRASLMPAGSGSSGRWNWRPGCTRRGQPRQRRRRR